MKCVSGSHNVTAHNVTAEQDTETQRHRDIEAAEQHSSTQYYDRRIK